MPDPKKPWKFVTPAEFLDSVDQRDSCLQIQANIRHLQDVHKLSERELLRRALLCLRAVNMSLPVDAAQGLDCKRADPTTCTALPSLREIISHLLALPDPAE